MSKMFTHLACDCTNSMIYGYFLPLCPDIFTAAVWGCFSEHRYPLNCYLGMDESLGLEQTGKRIDDKVPEIGKSSDENICHHFQINTQNWAKEQEEAEGRSHRP